MRKRKVIYISDQKFYLDKNNCWYTTSSFPEELLDVFEELEEWVFFGRLFRIDNAENLYNLNFNRKGIKITFTGIWESSSGLKGYVKNFFRYLKLLNRYIKSSDVVYLKFSFIASYISGLVSNFKNKILITHMVGDIECIKLINNSIPIQILVWIQKELYKKILKKAHIQIYVSEDLKEKYSEGSTTSIVVCENRIKKENIISPIKIKEKKIDGNLKLLFVGRLSPEKGLSDLIYAMKKVPNVTLDIIGSGEYKKALEKIIINMQLDNRINFLGYKRWGDELFNSFLDYHCLVLPSYSEGLPLVIIEAMSMGLPVIASDVGGIPEIITHGENGLLFKPGNINELEDSINSMKNNENLRQSFIVKGINTAHKYSLENQLTIFKKALVSTSGS